LRAEDVFSISLDKTNSIWYNTIIDETHPDSFRAGNFKGETQMKKITLAELRSNKQTILCAEFRIKYGYYPDANSTNKTEKSLGRWRNRQIFAKAHGKHV